VTEINIAIAFDHAYIKPFYVLTTSIFLNTRKKTVVIHALAPDLCDEDRASMTEHARRFGGRIVFYPLDAALINNLSVPENSPFSTAIFYRLLFPGLMPTHVSRLLYLDTDTIVMGDLSDLFDIVPDTTPVAAVSDRAMPLRGDLGMVSKGEYFNSGVLLINVNVWKKQDITKKAIDYILSNNHNLFYVDQDALNKVLQHNWQRLSQRYNAMPTANGDLQTGSGNVTENPVIIHYAGQPKPWGVRYSPFKAAYDDYYRQFLNTPIGRKTIRTDLEEAFARMIGVEPAFQNWTDEKIIESAICLHLIWLKKVRSLLGSEAFKLLLSRYYSAYNRNEGLRESLAHMFSPYEEKVRLVCSHIFHGSADDRVLPHWSQAWNALCEQEINTRIVMSEGLLSPLQISSLVFVPEFINQQLMIMEPTRSLLFFILEKSVADVSKGGILAIQGGPDVTASRN
jgi:lipopolysaccharide biosynthesis glycosyltransferase